MKTAIQKLNQNGNGVNLATPLTSDMLDSKAAWNKKWLDENGITEKHIVGGIERLKNQSFNQETEVSHLTDKTQWLKDHFAGLTGKALMAKQYIEAVGLTSEVLQENMKRIKSQPPPPSSPPSPEEIIKDYESSIFELISEGEALDCTIRQLQTTLAEKDKLIAELQAQLEQANQKQPVQQARQKQPA